MKKVIMLSPTVPDENGWGVQRRAANHLKALRQDFEVYLVVIKPHDRVKDMPGHLAELCGGMLFIGPETRRPPVRLGLPMAAYLNEVLLPSYRRNMPVPPNMKLIADFINGSGAENVFCFRIRTAVLFDMLEKDGSLKGRWYKVVDYDDIESIALRREVEKKADEVGFEYQQIQQLRIKHLAGLENRFLNSFDVVMSCSEEDKQRLEQQKHQAKIVVIPNCVPLPKQFTPVNDDEDEINILFVGAMRYLPNKDAAIWFVEKILPKINERSPKPLSVTLVGFDPDQQVRDLGNTAGVTVTGGVDSVEPYFNKCHFFISPIRFGGGTRIKILEAMSYGKAIVSTTIGVEGIAVINGKNIVIADDEEQFANSCLELMASSDKINYIGANARNIIRDEYTLNSIVGKFSNAFLNC